MMEGEEKKRDASVSRGSPGKWRMKEVGGLKEENLRLKKEDGSRGEEREGCL